MSMATFPIRQAAQAGVAILILSSPLFLGTAHGTAGSHDGYQVDEWRMEPQAEE